MKAFYTVFLLLIVAMHCSAQTEHIDDGYTDTQSYRHTIAGSYITFYTKYTGTQTTPFSLTLFKLNGTSTGVTINGFNTDDQLNLPNLSDDPWENGFKYAPTCTTWTVPTNADLPSGYYLLDNKIPIIIKDEHYPSTADIVIVCPTNTINAYTSSGGHSLYDATYTTVSFLRPQSRAQYQNIDDGFFNWWATTFDPNHLLHVNFISDKDMDDYDEIKNAKLLIIPGHSEYWTRKARLNFDKFIDNGMIEVGYDRNALILSGNTMWWQVRFQDDPNNATNPQLVCYRGSNWCDPVTGLCGLVDPIFTTDPLLVTYHWNDISLKYSILGSIGSDWLRCVYGKTLNSQGNTVNNPFCFNGHKIILTGSPLLSGITLPPDNIIPIPTTYEEYDGTLVKTDANGNVILNNGVPELDLAALGFYRGEIIGYDCGLQVIQQNDPLNSNITSYAPFMILKKTKTAGTIVNVNSNRWCTDDAYGWSGGNPLRANITANMINKLMDDATNHSHGDYLFMPNTTPNSITVSPSYTNVSYSICSGGSVNYTPDGIYLDQAFKRDNGFTFDNNDNNNGTRINYENNIAQADFDPNCSTYPIFKIAAASNQNNTNNEQTDELIFSLYPNPTMSTFMLQIQTKSASVKDVSVYNAIGAEIFHLEKLTDSSTIIDLAKNPTGIYFVKLIQEGKETVKKIIYM